jgi:hypothetical protein
VAPLLAMIADWRAFLDSARSEEELLARPVAATKEVEVGYGYEKGVHPG